VALVVTALVVTALVATAFIVAAFIATALVEATAMVVQDHWILDDAALIKISSCLHGVDVNAVFDSSARDHVLAAKVHLSRQLRAFVVARTHTPLVEY